MDIKEALESLKPLLNSIFQHLHEHPEISWEERQTTAFIVDLLNKFPCSVQTFNDCTGAVAEIGDGEFTVGLRTDIDALWQEVDGEFKANHSCGHDGHMTIALGVFLLLNEIGYRPNGRLKFLFQPAEEKGTGALRFVEKGMVDGVDYLYGVHLRPADEVPDGYAAPAILHGAAQFIKGEIIGTDAHGARPHQGQNAIEIGAEFISMINGIHLDPSVPYSAKMTRFQAGGESSNIIPGKAAFSLDLRAQKNEVMEQLKERIFAVSRALTAAYGVDIRLESGANVAAAVASEEAQSFMAAAIKETFGESRLVPPVVTTGGEDFHFYTLKNPHLKATMLGLGCGLAPGLHHPKMHFNQEALFAGIEILARAIIKTFETYGDGTYGK